MVYIILNINVSIEYIHNFWADIVDAINSGSFPENTDLKVSKHLKTFVCFCVYIEWFCVYIVLCKLCAGNDASYEKRKVELRFSYEANTDIIARAFTRWLHVRTKCL